MSNQKLLKVLNPVMGIVIIVTIAAVAIYKYSPFLNLQGNELVYEIHEIAGKLFVLLAICHVILNWNWVKTQIFGIKPKSKPARKKK